jgi:polysaccharide deacetylase 2 family uncharacterized protein YibQ
VTETGRAVARLASLGALFLLFAQQLRTPAAPFAVPATAPPARSESAAREVPAQLVEATPARAAAEVPVRFEAPAPAASPAGTRLPPPAAAREATAGPRIALIIDDLGYRPAEGRRAVRLPGAVAVAILPHTPHAAALAREAESRGKEVVLHVPMQALEESAGLGPGALDLSQSRADLLRALADDLAAVPHVRAVSNHMGSSLTREAGPMRWIMEELKKREPLFFVDSYTTAQSVALEVARETGVRALRRNVFLDGDPAPGALQREWRRLLALARDRGFAVGIGHPHPATLDFLERELPALAASGIELVTLVRLLEGPAAAE